MTIVASNAMHDAGYTAVDKAKLLKGKKIAIQAPGSIDQYLFGRAAEKAGLDPIQDLNWSSGMPYPDMIKLMGADKPTPQISRCHLLSSPKRTTRARLSAPVPISNQMLNLPAG